MTETMPKLSHGGQVWVNATLHCLQEALVPILNQNTTMSCKDLKDFAFDSHPACYTGDGSSHPSKPSICHLPVGDMAHVVGTIDTKDEFSLDGLEQEAKVAAICAKQIL